jgi:hypothetical protein
MTPGSGDPKRPGFPPKGPGGPGGPGTPGGPGGLGQPTTEELDANLVELTVYGIAALYERPKPPETAPTGNQPPGTTPPVPGTPGK